VRRLWGAALASLAACARSDAAPAAPAAPAPPAAPSLFDILIVNTTVVDGTGAPGFVADVALRGDRIARVSRGAIARDGAARVIDGTGRVLAPGFIDMHAHLEPLLRLPEAENLVRQGVTTALGGPDGFSPWPLGPYLDTAQAAGPALNVAFLVGHNTIRRRVLGLGRRAPTAAELARMRRMVARAMHEGAFGLSTGLTYAPGAFAATDEIVALARVAADSGGIYTTHVRDEGDGVLAAVAEAIAVGRRAGIPVVLTHHKVLGPRMWGASGRTLALVDSARAGGVDVMLDQYPYAATSAGVGVLVPAWAVAGGSAALARRLRDPVLRDSIRRAIISELADERGGGDLRRIQFARVVWDPSLEGKTLYDLAARRGVDTTLADAADLVLDVVARGDASAIYHVLSEEDVERILRHPQTMIGSDGRLVRPGEGRPHPRWYGAFPRILGVYVRERRVLSLEQAIHKMTGLPAARLGLADRGRIAEGLAADLVVFDPAAVGDRATYEDPHRYPAGVEYVLVGGVPVVDGGRFTGARPGRVLRRPRGRGRRPRQRPCAASRASSACLRAGPQRYPPAAPSARTTRWQGTTSATGLVAHARATARAARGRPRARATWA
jgi:dihydroorotase/N-acyl-D-amino-acid deacylase